MLKVNWYLMLSVLIFFLTSCSSDDELRDLDESIVGSGSVMFDYSFDGFNKSMEIFYHIPQNKTQTTPILIVFHGVGRNASDYRNSLIERADALNFIVIAPKFSTQNFPGGDQYNLGNVYVDGDNPSANTLNPEGEWAFSIVEPLFDFIKEKIGNSNPTYKIFGHSAGAQFAHRFLLFKENNRADQIVVSAAGWYTFPDESVDFPYGISNSILLNSSLELFLAKNIRVQVGELDSDPETSSLRRNVFADAQGLHRLERATNFFNFSQELAQNLETPFNWNFTIRNAAGHNFRSAAVDAANYLYQ